ncbi:hypothetical protein ACFQ21_06825 [Ohtaekwangia kribbensis]|uniref:Uncharacterized protein n=1 Tax=Ohtaekwangia kribbensis TaxID=688913 RepID=A0ABW3K1Z1_9BACT
MVITQSAECFENARAFNNDIYFSDRISHYARYIYLATSPSLSEN